MKTIHTISSTSFQKLQKLNIRGYDIAYNEEQKIRIDQNEPCFKLILHFKPLPTQSLKLVTFTDKKSSFTSILTVIDKKSKEKVTYRKF